LAEVQNTLGEYYWARGQVKDAGAAWELAVKLNPNQPEILSNFAWWRWSRIQKDGVKEVYEKALELDRLNLQRYAELGSFLAIENYPEEARELLIRIEELFDSVAAYRVLANLHDFLGDVDISIAWTIRAHQREPDDITHVAKLAEYYADIGDFETALRLDPEGIGILFKMRRYRDAIDLAELAMIDRPNDIRTRSILAIAHNALDQYEAAVHVLRDTGLPDSVFDGWRSGADLDGYQALTNALYGMGNLETARELAQWRQDFGHTDSRDWWVTIQGACESAILGNDEDSRMYLERAQEGFHLPWDPVLKDSPCFDRLQHDPAYQATVRHFDERRAMLRERLPTTLAEFGVSL
ncbi:MAG: hypothetical protein R3212_14160, partial [Xanthomonadales bacterium]|nr:hypothetical protein [Xanthomonadales bacterium]